MRLREVRREARMDERREVRRRVGLRRCLIIREERGPVP